MFSYPSMHCHYLSEKLEVEADTVRHGVEGLMYLLTESAKLMVS